MLRRGLLFVFCGVLAACGGQESPESAAAIGSVAQAAASAAPAAAMTLPRTPAPEGASVYIISPAGGATVSSPVRIVFGLKGFGVVPAGFENATAGHHHLLIDTPLPPLGLPIPADAHHVHFGKGQTEAEIELAPGRHVLQLLVGDHRHVPHDPPIVSAPLMIEVR